MKRTGAPIIFALMGFAAIVAQIILQRRFMVIFGGNELTIGIVFAAWMFWAGLGNFAAGRFADRIRNANLALTLIFFLIAVILPLTVVSSSLVKAALGIPPSQMIGPPLIIASTLALLFPLCFLIGAALVVAAKVPGSGEAKDIGTVYIFDSIGSALGGLVFSWFAIVYMNPLQAAFFISAVLLAGAGLVLLKNAGSKLGAVFAAVIFAVLYFYSGSIETRINAVQWRGFDPIANLDSRFGNIVVTENRGEHTLFFDGQPQFTTPLAETYETTAYLPLLMKKDAKDVLLIGGGLSGMLANWREVPLDSITYVQIDPEVTEAEEYYMSSKEMMADPRLKIEYGDGRAFLVNASPAKYDIIIVQVGEPATASTNRYYTREFFDDAKRALKPDGIIFFAIFEPTNYMSAEAKRLLGSVYDTLGKAFDNIVVLPLHRYYFVASAEKGTLTDDTDTLAQRLKKSGFNAPTLLSQVLYGVYPERVAQIRDSIVGAASEMEYLNTDRYPVAYYAGLVLWAAKAGEGAAKFLESLQRIKWWHVVVAICAFAIITLPLMRSRTVEISSIWSLVAVGFSSIVYEMVLLIWYQVKVGLLFYRLGIIITAFMVGLSLGAFAAIKLRSQKSEVRSQKVLELCLIAFALYMPLLFMISKLSFPLANLLCGAAAGFIYQLVAERLVEKRKAIGTSAGLINFSDYLGAAIGSILAAIIMIPLFGLFPTLLVAAVMLLTSSVLGLIIQYRSTS